MIKAVFFDCDGTIYSHATNRIPDSVFFAFESLHKKGISTVLCTGRVTEELEDLGVNRLPFDYEILLNGALVLKHGKKIAGTPLSKRDILSVYHFLQTKELSVQFLEEKRMYMNFVSPNARKVLSSIHTAVPPLGNMEDILQNDIYQIITYDLKTTEELFSSMHDAKQFIWIGDGAVDINHKDAGKGTGMKAVEEALHLKKEEIMAFGDADNDVEMLQRAGVAIAMGNGNDTIKNVAGEITDDIDADGIYKALKRHSLIESLTS